MFQLSHFVFMTHLLFFFLNLIINRCGMPDGAKEEDANATMGEYSLYYTKWPRKKLTWSIVRYGKMGELGRSTIDNILAQVRKPLSFLLQWLLYFLVMKTAHHGMTSVRQFVRDGPPVRPFFITRLTSIRRYFNFNYNLTG